MKNITWIWDQITIYT